MFSSQFQIGDKSDDRLSSNSSNAKSGGNYNKLGPRPVGEPVSLMMTNKSSETSDCAIERKSKKKIRKCQVRNMCIGLKLSKASFVLRKKKKHKKSKLHTLDSQNLVAQTLDDGISSDPGPSNTEKPSTSMSARPRSKKKAAKRAAQKKSKICDGDSLINGVNGELRDRAYQNGAVLATDGHMQKNCSSITLNGKKATEPSSNDCKKDLPERKNKRVLEETTSE